MKDEDISCATIIKSFADKTNIDLHSFYQKCKELQKEIIVCQILSNWYWIIWSVITAKTPGMLFNHIHYAQTRFDIFNGLKKKLAKLTV